MTERSPRPRLRLVIGGLALAASALVATACGGEDRPAGGRAQNLSITLTEPAANRFQIQGVKPVPAGVVNISFRNRGTKPHEIQLIRVDGNQSPQQVLSVIQSEDAPIPAWLHGSGGVGATDPGATQTSSQVLQPGTYHVMDTGRDQSAGDDAPSYAEQGAVARLEVTGGEATGSLPSAPAKITAVEYGFATAGLKTGKNRVEFANAGREFHHVVAAPIQSGKTLADVRRAFASEDESGSPPPLDFASQTTTPVLDGGGRQVLDLNFKKPGKYALLCFITDRAGGPPHVAKGMVAEVQIR